MDVIENFQRITQSPGIMGGKACIQGTRVTVARVVNQIGMGQSIESLLEDYPYLSLEDVLEALRYAAWLTEGHEIEIVQA
jgi:uncharacterized protein (DUF433 family)